MMKNKVCNYESEKRIKLMVTNFKGQVNIYFIISTILFVSLSIYLISIIIEIYPTHQNDISSDVWYSKAYSVSELLIKDSGYPKDWDETNFERIGLASEPYSLNSTKINEFEKICNSTTNLTKIQKFRDSFGLENNNLVVEINYLNNTNIIKCKPTGEKVGATARIKRIATLNNKLVEVIVYVG